jgi:threonine/homoserine/homoserine lactone efflux protein
MLKTLFDIISSGFIIGVLVSAPMGPVGLLCIQRSLNKGQWHGFFSGVGATFSDLLYAGITCLGMGFVIDFITGHQGMLQIVGSILLMGFGVYIFQSNPSKRLKKPKLTGNSFSQDAISAFFLTLANPFIIFLYIALFARFNFIVPEEKQFSILLGLSGIAAGALSWWFIITFITGKLRKVINVRGLWILNKIVGSVIIVLSILGMIYSLTGKSL